MTQTSGYFEDLNAQRKITDQYGPAFLPPEPNAIVGMAVASLDRLPLNALRHPAEGSTCGWYIWGGELSQDPTFFQALHASHVADYAPALLPFLALKPGWRVLLLPGHADAWYDPKLLNI